MSTDSGITYNMGEYLAAFTTESDEYLHVVKFEQDADGGRVTYSDGKTFRLRFEEEDAR